MRRSAQQFMAASSGTRSLLLMYSRRMTVSPAPGSLFFAVRSSQSSSPRGISHRDNNRHDSAHGVIPALPVSSVKRATSPGHLAIGPVRYSLEIEFRFHGKTVFILFLFESVGVAPRRAAPRQALDRLVSARGMTAARVS